MHEIVDIVRFNDHYAYVLNEPYSLTYEKHGALLIGSDETRTFYDVLKYGPCGGNPNFGGNYAFGGRKFDLPMKDGGVTHCYGQYWSEGVGEAAALLGIRFADFAHSTRKELKQCYVFCSGIADFIKLEEMEARFQSENPGCDPWRYWEYEKYIKENPL